MAKGKKKTGAKQAQNNDEDDDFLDALIGSKAEGGETVEPDAEKKEESAAGVAAVEKEVEDKPQDAAAAFLAAQGLGPDGDGEKKDNKKKKKKKKGAGADAPKAEEKVRIGVCTDARTLATKMLGAAMIGIRSKGITLTFEFELFSLLISGICPW
jgi:hypothetical protein